MNRKKNGECEEEVGQDHNDPEGPLTLELEPEKKGNTRLCQQYSLKHEINTTIKNGKIYKQSE